MRLGLLSDLHLRNRRGGRAWHNPDSFHGFAERFELALHGFKAQGVDAVALLGDLTDLREERLALDAVDMARRLTGVPVLALAGNHDAPAVGAALLEPNREAAAALGAELLDPPVDDGTVLALDLPDAPSLVLSHYPVVPLRAELEGRGLKYPGDHRRRAELQRWVQSLPGPVVVVAGHLHVRAAFLDGPRLHIQLGPIIEHPFDATLLELTADRVRLEATELPGGAWEAETRLAPAEATLRYADGAWVVG